VDGEQELRIAGNGGTIDVVVTDLTMPHVDGEELARQIRETRPYAGIVLMSGVSESSLDREGRIRQHGYFLEEPITPASLVDGEQALRIAGNGGTIDVVVTDLTMPHVDGEELARQIRETRQYAGIVLMSGFSESSLVREGRIRQHGYFLEKPFTPAALVDV